MLRLVDRFGYDAAHHAPIAELRQMIAAENVYKAYRSRENYRDKDDQPNWFEWAGNNPELNELLDYAVRVAREMDNDGNS
jgi:hypothetical protein